MRDTIIIAVSIILAAVLITAGGLHLDHINNQRKALHLVVNEPLENIPPKLAITTAAMGAFRGLLVDILWMRAETLKEEGQFFDAKQLAEWITALQPRFAEVWAFHAWNMAYNISAAIPSSRPAERWRWVKNGYELLRDRGLQINPKSMVLYRELAMIFQHKIGGVSDEAHRYYKLQLALAMEPLVSPPTDEHFEKLAKAPRTLQEIMADAKVAALVAKLGKADSRFEDMDNLVSNYLSLRENPRRFADEAFEVIDQYRGTETLDKFDTFAKAYQLRNVWKLDPVLMQEINHTYGPVDWRDPNAHLPLDWRHPCSHSIYWALKGLRTAGKTGVAKGREEEYSAAEINTDRMLYHSLQDLFRAGKIFIYTAPAKAPSQPGQEPVPPRQTIYLRPDLRMFEPYNRHILKVIEKYVDPNSKELASHQIGHRNMLKNAILSFYQAGHVKQARKIYRQLRTLYPSKDFEVPLEQFVKNRFLEELKTLHIFNVRELLVMLLRESYFYYAMRQDDDAFGREKLAREIYEYYHKEFSESERIDVPPLSKLRYVALQDFLQDRQFPPELQRALLGRIKLERPDLYEKLRQQEEQLRKQLEQMRK